MKKYQAVLIEKVKTIMENPNSERNYFAWPSIIETKDGKLIVGASGYRKRHVCPYGTVVVTDSEDGGKTWGPLRTIINTCLDDRDCGLATFGESGVIATSFNNTVENQRMRAMKMQYGIDEAEQASTLAHLDTITPEEEAKVLGSVFTVSFDNGQHFGELYKSPITSPHGPIETKNGEILWCGARMHPEYPYTEEEGIECYVVNPYTGEMTFRGKIAPLVEGEEKWQSHEPYMIELPSGKMICHIRAEGKREDYNEFSMFQSVSYDSGKTWSVPERLLGKRGGAPAHLMLHSSGVLICMYTWREAPYEIRAIVSEDEGVTWSEPITVCDTNSITRDIGYPMSVELEDGEILTVFYAHDAKNAPAVIKQIRWRLV